MGINEARQWEALMRQSDQIITLLREIRDRLQATHPQVGMSEQDKDVSYRTLRYVVGRRLGAFPAEDEVRTDVLRVISDASTPIEQIEALAKAYGADAVWAARQIAGIGDTESPDAPA